LAVSAGISRGIVNLLTASLKGYINDPKVIYEKFRVEPIQIEPRPDIPLARIALYEDSESGIAPVSDYRANIGEQTYLMDVSVVRAYSGDKANRGELIALDICDMIKDWSKQANYADITGEYLYSFEYVSSSRFQRNEKYTTRTMTFLGKRDLYKAQDLPLGQGFPFIFDFKLT
jgi:hypothetical protein